MDSTRATLTVRSLSTVRCSGGARSPSTEVRRCGACRATATTWRSSLRDSERAWPKWGRQAASRTWSRRGGFGRGGKGGGGGVLDRRGGGRGPPGGGGTRGAGGFWGGGGGGGGG